jgi:hypothetical protein
MNMSASTTTYSQHSREVSLITGCLGYFCGCRDHPYVLLLLLGVGNSWR